MRVASDVVGCDTTAKKSVCDVVDPMDPRYRSWEVLVAFSNIITCLLGMFMASFQSTPLAMWCIVYLGDAINISDIIIRFNLAYRDKRGVKITKRKDICIRYLKTSFLFDFVSMFPTDALSLFIHSSNPWKLVSKLRLNRIMQFSRVVAFFAEREGELGSNTALLRSLKYSVICLVTTHAITCMWFTIGCNGIHEEGAVLDCRPDSWATLTDLDEHDIAMDMTNHTGPVIAYVVSLYWAVATATSTGYGDITAVNTGEKWLSVVSMLLGIAVFFGMLLGGMTSMLTNFDEQRAAFVHRFNTIKEHLYDYEVPTDLQQQVIGYYEYLWVRKRGVLDDGIYSALPLTFQAEISHTTNSGILEKAPIFKNMSTGFMRMLSMNIKPQLCLPQQIIITRGDVGHQMFFIHRGEVEVLSEEDDDTPIATLKSGKLFGEVSLIYSLPRTATVRAKTHCDLMVLSKFDLNAILKHYPEIAAHLHDTAKERCKAAEQVTAEDSPSINPHYKAFQPRKQSFIEPIGHGRRKSFASNTPEIMGGHSNFHYHKQHHTIKISNSLEVIQSAEIEEDNQDDTGVSDGHRCLSWCSSKMKTIKEVIQTTTINPHGIMALWWRYLVIAVTVVISVIYPYMACFTALDTRNGYLDNYFGHVLMALTYMLDLILIMDIAFSLRLEVATPHGTMENFDDIVRYYCHSFDFVLDVLAVLPIEVFCVIQTEEVARNNLFAMLRLNRLIKFFKVPKTFSNLEDTLEVSILKVRSFKFVLYICMLTHWVACSLFGMVCWGEECAEESWFDHWIEHSDLNSTDVTPAMEYVLSIYWAAVTMTSTGYGDIVAFSLIGRSGALTAMVVGLFLYGYCLAAMAATLTNTYAPYVNYQEKLFAVKAFMMERGLSRKLQKHVISYLSNLWEKHKGEWMPGESTLMHDAPTALQQDIALEDMYYTLALCPLFRDTEESFLRALALKAQPYLFSPGEIIIYAGDSGREMYCVRRGRCEILSPDKTTQLSEVSSGSYFGEIGMLFGDYRAVTVRAMTHVEVLELRMSDLEEIFKDFPLVEIQFKMASDKRDQLEELKAAKGATIGENLSNTRQSRSILKLKSEMLAKETQYYKSGTSLNITATDVFSRASLQGSFVDFSKMKHGGEEEEEYLEGFQHLGLLPRLLSYLLMRRTFLPSGHFVKSWTMAMVVFSLVHTFTIPLQASFFPHSLTLLGFHYLLDIISFANLYICLHISYYNKEKVVVTHPVYTAHHYFQTNFWLDFFSCFPWELLVLSLGLDRFDELFHFYVLLRMNRMLSIYRVQFAFSYLESAVQNFKYAGVVRAVKFFCYSLIFLHIVTCLLFLLASPPQLAALWGGQSDYVLLNGTSLLEESWIINVVEHNNMTLDERTPMYALYIISLYWASATSVSVGYGDISAHLGYEMVVSSFVMILGVLFFGYIIASVTASITNANTGRTHFQEKLSFVSSYLEDHDLDHKIRERVLNHYNYVWLRTKGIEPECLFKGLPMALWGDVTLGLYRSIISKISLFKDVEESFIKMISKCIKPMLFLKGEFIVKKYDIGHEMFFIHHGCVEVTSEDGKIIFDTMRAGEAFGEVALLFNCPRTASVVAKTNCDVFVLTREDLDMTLASYPEIKRQVQMIAKERLNWAKERSVARIMELQNNADGSACDIEGDSYCVDWPNPSDTMLSGNTNQNNPRHGTEETLVEEFQLEPESRPSTINRFRKFNRFTMSPTNTFMRRYLDSMCGLGVLSCWLIIYQVAFQDHHMAVLTINYICDVCFAIEIFLKFHLSYYDQYGDLVEDFDQVCNTYLKDFWGFSIDFLAVIPVDVFALLAPPGSKLMVLSLLRVLHILRVYRTMKHFNKWEQELDVNMFMMKLYQNLVTLGLLMHIFSSIWNMMACPPYASCRPETWMKYSDTGTGSPIDKYCTCLYWCIATMTSTGYGDVHAHRLDEMLFASVVMIFGKLVFGFILGNIASTLAHAESNRVKYDQKLESVKNSMIDQTVPPYLQKRVIAYFDHLWLRHKGIDVSHLFSDASMCLKADIALSISRNMLQSIPLFEGADESFLRQLSLKVKELLFLPGDYIVKKGDMGLELLYIDRGEVEVLSDDDPPVVTDMLQEGQMFGEVSLLASVPRRVTVRAHTYVDILSISRLDLHNLLQYYPVMEAKIKESGRRRFGDILNRMHLGN